MPRVFDSVSDNEFDFAKALSYIPPEKIAFGHYHDARHSGRAKGGWKAYHRTGWAVLSLHVWFVVYLVVVVVLHVSPLLDHLAGPQTRRQLGLRGRREGGDAGPSIAAVIVAAAATVLYSVSEMVWGTCVWRWSVTRSFAAAKAQQQWRISTAPAKGLWARYLTRLGLYGTHSVLRHHCLEWVVLASQVLSVHRFSMAGASPAFLVAYTVAICAHATASPLLRRRGCFHGVRWLTVGCCIFCRLGLPLRLRLRFRVRRASIPVLPAPRTPACPPFTLPPS